METRKVQMIGKSSLMVTLPKEWTESNGIKKNDALFMSSLADGSLLVSPILSDEHVKSIFRIDADKLTDLHLLYRVLVGTYMSGYGSVEVVSEKRIPNDARDAIRKMTQAAVGVEIVEETDHHILLKDLVDPSEMKMMKSIGRMRALVINMFSDVLAAATDGNVRILDGMKSTDDDVDKLEWLITRQTSLAHYDPSVYKKTGIDRKGMIRCYTLSRMLERIGDQILLMAKSVRILSNIRDSEIMDMVLHYGNEVLKRFSSAMDAWSGEDMRASLQNIRQCEALIERSWGINRMALSLDAEHSLSAAQFAECLRKVCEHTIDIGEHSINTAV